MTKTAGERPPARPPGCLALLLHAHLPFVRHPEQDRFLEEDWLYEAITETYAPLLRMLEGWEREGTPGSFSLTLSPTLCSMLLDPLLQGRYLRRLEGLIELADKESLRTRWEPAVHKVSRHYGERFRQVRDLWLRWGHDLVPAFRHFQDTGRLEILTCTATHALLPLLMGRPESARAQIMVARDHYRACFGRDPRGIWLPECAYAAGVGELLAQANLRWFVVETHGLLRASPRPRHASFAPVFTRAGVAVFGRDIDSAKQVWSREGGYPGDPAYRDFYRDIAFDLDQEYLEPYQPAPGYRTFTGIKYHRITGPGAEKGIYDRAAALARVEAHARHFLDARLRHLEEAAKLMPQPPIMVAPYDAELFGHWWYEGPEFLQAVFARAAEVSERLIMTTPGAYLRQYPTHQVAEPGASTWGEDGYLKVWINESNQWIYPHLEIAEARMTELARANAGAEGLLRRALNQAGRELMLAQASDWPFMIRTGASPAYATRRIKEHVLRFTELHDRIQSNALEESWVADLEAGDNIFPGMDYRYWA